MPPLHNSIYPHVTLIVSVKYGAFLSIQSQTNQQIINANFNAKLKGKHGHS